ncbi:hypothetical protein GCM10022419_116880 [Nonomuraea rosea]|uniref:DUF11 domain-containing protein n=1 Tax=Nonomuraea rosea TaxID=638574 RepID=A0ABP6ZK72_9ACTN
MREWQKGAVRLGFSDGKLPQLAEGSLLENNGISDGADFTFWWTDNRRAPTGPRLLRSGRGNGPLNWNDSTTPGTNAPLFDTAGISQNLNDRNGLTTLQDHDDWAAIKFRGPGSPDARGWACSSYPAGAPACIGAGGSADRELDFSTVIHQEMAFFNRYDPDVKVAKSVDKADSEPGDTLTYNNTAQATTKVHAPRFTLEKTTFATVNAGAEMKIDLQVANVGSGTATGVVLTDTLPAEVYYSQTLDRGSGPEPSKATRNADGTTTLTWSQEALAGGKELAVQFTARPSLLHTAGARLTDRASVVYGNAKGCTFPPVTASASTTVTEVTPTRDPRSHGYWKTRSQARTWELLARVQATDQRFDGSAGGELENSEAEAVLNAGGPQPGPVRFQLLATLLDLAARQINAATRIDSELSRRLGAHMVGEAVRYAFATLTEPLNSTTAGRYSDTTALLDEIVNNRSEVYE